MTSPLPPSAQSGVTDGVGTSNDSRDAGSTLANTQKSRVRRDALVDSRAGDVVDRHIKPRMKGALRHLLVGVAGQPCRAACPGMCAPQARGALGEAARTTRATPCMRDGTAGAHLLAADFVVDSDFNVWLVDLALCDALTPPPPAPPSAAVPVRTEVEANLHRLTREAAGIAAQANATAGSVEGQARTVECVEGFEYLYDELDAVSAEMA